MDAQNYSYLSQESLFSGYIAIAYFDEFSISDILFYSTLLVKSCFQLLALTVDVF